MSNIVLSVEGLEFHADSASDEPRVLDLRIAERAGVAFPRNVRRVIKAMIADGSFRENEHFRVWAQRAQTPAGGRPATEYLLSEAGALKLMTRLRTPAAYACVDDMIRVYRAALLQLRSPPPAPGTMAIPVARDDAHAPRIDHFPEARGTCAMLTKLVAKHEDRSVQAVQGELRRRFEIVSVYRVNILLWPLMRKMLEDALFNGIPLVGRTPRRLAAVVDIRQTKLFPNGA